MKKQVIVVCSGCGGDVRVTAESLAKWPGKLHYCHRCTGEKASLGDEQDGRPELAMSQQAADWLSDHRLELMDDESAIVRRF